MKIDSHQHFWIYDPDTYSWVEDLIRRDFVPGDLEPVLREEGFEACIAVQADQSEEETVRLLEWANSNAFVAGVVGWLDLTSEELRDRLELYTRDPHFIGLRHTEWDRHGEFMDKADFNRGIGALAEFGLTYDILAFDYQLEPALGLVRRFPDQVFVLDHLGKPVISEGVSSKWEERIRAIGNSENTYCKISGLLSQAGRGWEPEKLYPYLDVAVEAFGVDRLLFGSDWPVCLSVSSFEQVSDFYRKYFQDFSAVEQNKIFGRNALRCYDLKKTTADL